MMGNISWVRASYILKDNNNNWASLDWSVCSQIFIVTKRVLAGRWIKLTTMIKYWWPNIFKEQVWVAVNHKELSSLSLPSLDCTGITTYQPPPPRPHKRETRKPAGAGVEWGVRWTRKHRYPPPRIRHWQTRNGTTSLQLLWWHLV